MKKTKCIFVKLKSLDRISLKAFKAEDYNGNSDILPVSQVFHEENNGAWIAEWILEKKSLAFSRKKEGWFNPNTNKIEPTIEVIKVKPDKVFFDPNDQPDESLFK